MKKRFASVLIPLLYPVFMNTAQANDTNIAFADIPTKGDARLQSIIETIRRTPHGEYLYQHGAKTNLKFQWTDALKNKTSASYGKDQISASPAYKDDKTTILIVHEMHHHWRKTMFDIETVTLSPMARFNALHLEEVESCAQTAAFVASHKDITGKNLIDPTEGFTTYGQKTAYSYALRPAPLRDMLHHAYEPCFNEINTRFKAYEQKHTTNVVPFLRNGAVALKGALEKKDTPQNVLRTHFTPMSAEHQTALYRSYFMTDLQRLTIHPAITAMDANTFSSWLADRTGVRKNQPLGDYQKSFERYRDLAKELIREQAHP